MSISEIFANPTVKTVSFEIRFPNLFYVETRIPEFQVEIMNEFPDSSLGFRKKFFFTDMPSDVKFEEIKKNLDNEQSIKIWHFKSNKKIDLNITNNSLVLTSEHHKTYNLEGSDKFRDIITLVLGKFFDKVSVPFINRLGLRYIDECPITSKDDATFKSYYNTVFPLERFSLADCSEMSFKTVIKKDQCFVRYVESLEQVDDIYKLKLDFDGFANNIKPDDCLAVTDKLHGYISQEYENTIKEPVKEFMRKNKG
jgi:uncharacterized protein (TIGR04255 family)